MRLKGLKPNTVIEPKKKGKIKRIKSLVLKNFIKPKALEDFLLMQDYDESVLLMMSSGNYGDISWDIIMKLVNLGNFLEDNQFS